MEEMAREEFDKALMEMVQDGQVIAFLEDGEVMFILPESATPEQKEWALTTREIKKLMAEKEMDDEQGL